MVESDADDRFDPETADQLRRRLERILLGGRRKYTRLQVAERAGVSDERSLALWRALGFAAAEDDEIVFTDADVEAMRMTDHLVRSGLLDGGLETSVARALGQHLSRLAELQIDLLWTLFAENPELAHNDRQVGRVIDNLLPELESVQNFVWRRHLAAFAGRAFTGGVDPEARLQVVGFVDMVGYTRLTRRVEEAELIAVLERFESVAAETVAEHHGRVVKMIGDEVLFVADSVVDAAEVALALSERADADDTLPPVRAGMAAGRVLNRFGDVYGPVVNLAARLTSLARPGTILVDREMAGELGGVRRFEVRSRRPVAVRGYNRVRPSALRRALPENPGSGTQDLTAEMLGLRPGRVPDKTRRRRRG